MPATEKVFEVIVIGGGLAGLSAALELNDKGMSLDDIIVLEANSRVGGKHGQVSHLGVSKVCLPLFKIS